MTSRLVGSTVPTVITAFVGFLMIIEYVFRIPMLQNLAADIRNWGIVIGAFALFLGVENLTTRNLRRIMRKEKGMLIPSIVCLACLYGMFLSGLPTIFGENSPVFDFLYRYGQTSLDVTTKAILAFFVLSGAYRAFRAKTWEGTAMLVSAFCVMFFMIPLGMFLGPVPVIGQWIFEGPVTNAMSRTFNIGVLFGLMALGIRTLIGRGAGISRLLASEAKAE